MVVGVPFHYVIHQMGGSDFTGELHRRRGDGKVHAGCSPDAKLSHAAHHAWDAGSFRDGSDLLGATETRLHDLDVDDVYGLVTDERITSSGV